MGTPLDYQKTDQAKRDNRKHLRLAMFGPSQSDVWQRLAEEIGARHEKGKWWSAGDRVVASVPPWQVVLDTHLVSYGKSAVTYTRLRAPYVNADGFRFDVFRRHLFSSVAKLFKLQDVEVGFKDFDDAFIIRGNNEAQLKRLFADANVRELLSRQADVRFQVTGDGRIFKKQFPQGVDQVQLLQLGVVKDLDQLKSMYDLFAATLHRLCHIGAAYEDDPKVTI